LTDFPFLNYNRIVKNIIHKITLILIIISTLVGCKSTSLFDSAYSSGTVSLPGTISGINSFSEAVTFLTVHAGNVYAGTKNTTSGAEIYLISGNTSTKVLDPSAGIFPSEGWGASTPYISSMATFGGRLYAGIYCLTGGRVYRTVSTASVPYTWERVYQHSDALLKSVDAMIEFSIPSSYLYIGLSGSVYPQKVRIYRSASGANSSFAEVNTFFAWTDYNIKISNFYISNDAGASRLFVAIAKDANMAAEGCELWWYDGSSIWQARVNNNAGTYTLGAKSSGFAPGGGGGYDNNVGIDSLLYFNGYLYIGVLNIGVAGAAYTPFTGTKIWRSDNLAVEANYQEVVNDGFGDINNISIDALLEYGGYIYALTRNNNGTQMWRSSTGDAGSWTKRFDNGYGDATNISGRSAVVFAGSLYIGLEKSTGVSGASLIRFSAAP
jgi:hypothetical protein